MRYIVQRGYAITSKKGILKEGAILESRYLANGDLDIQKLTELGAIISENKLIPHNAGPTAKNEDVS